jgi:hypothetical protein
MSTSHFTMNSGVIAERVGDELLVLLPGRTDAVRLTGHSADVFLDIQAGNKVDASEPAVAALIDLGIVDASGLSRRGLIKAGAISVGAGLAVMVMPSAAAAASQVVVNLSGRWYQAQPSPSFYILAVHNPGIFPTRVPDLPPDLSVEDPSRGVTRERVLAGFDARANSWEWRDPEIASFDLANQGQRIGTFTFDGVIYRVTFLYD